MVSYGKWETVAEVQAPETTASVSLFRLDSPSEYLFRVFAVNARGLGRTSQSSNPLLVSGEGLLSLLFIGSEILSPVHPGLSTTHFI